MEGGQNSCCGATTLSLAFGLLLQLQEPNGPQLVAWRGDNGAKTKKSPKLNQTPRGDRSDDEFSAGT